MYSKLASHRGFRLSILAVSIGLIVGLYFLLVALFPPKIDARALIITARTGPSIEVDTDHVLYSQSTVYRRANPEFQEPADPYHLPSLSRHSDTFSSETWTRGGNSRQIRGELRDTETGRLVSLMIEDENSVFLYHETTGPGMLIATSSEAVTGERSDPGQQEWLIDQAVQDPAAGYEIEGAIISSWGKPAWVVKQRVELPVTEAADTGPLYPSQGPYLADLDIQSLEYRWTIDRESKMFVSTESWALVPTGSVLLERIEAGEPELLPLNSMPATWLDVPEDIPVFNPASPANLAASVTARPTSLENILESVSFDVYLPVTAELDRKQAIARFAPQSTLTEDWAGQGFSIFEAPNKGLALEVIYHSDAQSLTIMQGERKLLVPLMQSILPAWTNSESIELTIDGINTVVWVATEDNRNGAAPSRVVVMLEVQDNFLFIVSQGYARSHLLDIISTLQGRAS
jgi:hypothetical protein